MKLPDFIRQNVPLAGYSTLGVGGTADYFTDIKRIKTYNSRSEETYIQEAKAEFFVNLCETHEFAKENGLDIFVLGRGSNIMFADSGFRGLVLRMGMSRVHFYNDELWVEAGVLVSELVTLYENGYMGLECFAGLPGTVGGAIFGNAGCYGGQFWDVVEEVMFFDGEYFKTIKKDPVLFGYRQSIFKRNPNWIITGCRLKFEPKDRELVVKETKRIRKLRQTSQPKSPSVGCIFKNPDVDGEKVSAGLLIERAGLKGMCIGGAMISYEHANFFINLGGAIASDFLKLIKVAKSRVLEQSGILLEEEIIQIGEF
ncbi:MAG: UDP-N-acetylmuramate dehydrogenase [Candidatus Yanofskybacteria bacterium]|nr:UDP-N-acetylmuramate dehydrogenase [Candidatus Yanofskybacteria bacterium]